MRTDLTRALVVVGGAWLATVAPASAQTVAVAPDGLSIEALVAMALERAPALEAARTRIEVAEGERRQASLRPNPVASVDRQERFGGADAQTTIGLTWPLDLFRRDARVSVVDQDVRRATALADLERVDRAALVRVRAADLLAASRQLEVVRQMAQAARSRLDMLAARVESGAGRPLDRDLADVEWRRTDTEILRWQGEVDAALAALKAAVGWTGEAPLRLAAPLDDAIAGLPPAPPTASSDALARRPDVRAAEAMEARADAMADAARREGRFDLSVTAGYMRRDTGRERMNEAMVGVMVDLPWRNRQQGAVAAAQAEGRAARAMTTMQRQDAEAEMASAAARDAAASAAVERFRAGLMELASANLDVVREMWRLGQGTLFDVIEEERRYLSLQSEYTAALRELVAARAAVLRAWGVQS